MKSIPLVSGRRPVREKIVCFLLILPLILLAGCFAAVSFPFWLVYRIFRRPRTGRNS